ncbi:GNAT family N-acetyltransferase [Photorhabdus laumondii]|uniref:GNAT family N-acetyltransferase n=2 Tax=Photorhabdus laumondii TaxID=2218628 RepID=UPI0025B078B7|nr:GNAT family N-acetyltransferase [Photorhabdus laumondii]
MLAVRMGRLAVDQAFRNQGLGGALLADAIERTIRAEIASYALLVDAKDDNAVQFYRHHGFIALPDSLFTLFLPFIAVDKKGKKISGSPVIALNEQVYWLFLR